MSDWLAEGLERVSQIIAWCWNLLIENEYLQICICLGLVPIGFYIFGKAKESVSD